MISILNIKYKNNDIFNIYGRKLFAKRLIIHTTVVEIM